MAKFQPTLFLPVVKIVSSHQPDLDTDASRVGLCGNPANPNTTADITTMKSSNSSAQYCRIY